MGLGSCEAGPHAAKGPEQAVRQLARPENVCFLGGKFDASAAPLLAPFSHEQDADFDGYERHSRKYQEREHPCRQPPNAFISHTGKASGVANVRNG